MYIYIVHCKVNAPSDRPSDRTIRVRYFSTVPQATLPFFYFIYFLLFLSSQFLFILFFFLALADTQDQHSYSDSPIAHSTPRGEEKTSLCFTNTTSFHVGILQGQSLKHVMRSAGIVNYILNNILYTSIYIHISLIC